MVSQEVIVSKCTSQSHIEVTQEARNLHHRKKGKYPAYISLHVHLIVYDGVCDVHLDKSTLYYIMLRDTSGE